MRCGHVYQRILLRSALPGALLGALFGALAIAAGTAHAEGEPPALPAKDTDNTANTITAFSILKRSQRGAMVIQPDGKIIVSGRWIMATKPRVGETDHNWTLLRFNSDGSRDESFAWQNLPTNDRRLKESIIDSLVLQSDGKIVAGGQDKSESPNHFMLARYNPDGTLDKTFGKGGLVRTAFDPIATTPTVRPATSAEPPANAPAENTGLCRIALQKGGSIIVVGGGTAVKQPAPAIARTADNFTPYYILMRFNNKGQRDKDFGTRGKTIIQDQYFRDSLAVQHDGKILLSCYNQNNRALLTRFNSDGTLDTSFGVGGLSPLDLWTTVKEIFPLENGQIIVAPYAFALTRLNADGSPDRTFGSRGIVAAPSSASPGNNSIANLLDARLQSDGTIVMMGRSHKINLPPTGDFDVVRFKADGTLDTTFGKGGLSTAPLPRNVWKDNPVALSLNGHVIAAGPAQILQVVR